MARQLGRLEISALCTNCGFVKSHAAGDHVNRCSDCGRYVSDNPDVCCVKHELRESPYPSGECPYCEEERRVEAERRHMMTRDPTLEPY